MCTERKTTVFYVLSFIASRILKKKIYCSNKKKIRKKVSVAKHTVPLQIAYE
jgi:hypothetical protein